MNETVPIIDETVDASGDAADVFMVDIPSLGLAFGCRRDQHVLSAMQLAGVNGLPVGCRSGGCGVCRVQVTVGSYIVATMSRACISPADECRGLALACRIFPRSDLTIEPQSISSQRVSPQMKRAA